jgi:hypothetical protein
MGFEELFTTLFEDENLLQYLETKALLVEDEFPELKRMHNRKIQLFAELDKLVIELYQISPVLMDYDKLMQGEEGLVMYFDIEAIKSKKNKERNSYLDTKRIDIESTRQIVRILRKIARTLYNLSNSNKDIVNC